jgi:hypothetical protein
MDQDITEIDLNNTIQEVISNFESFLKGKHCNSVLEAINNGKRYGIDEENFDKMRFNIEQIPGTGIFSNPDIYYETAKNEIFILDWKTGKEDQKKSSISLQLKVCGLKLLTEEGITPKTFKIKAYNVYLPSNKEIGGVLTEKHIRSAVTSISKGIKKMQKHLVDVKNNIPAPEEAFLRTKSINRCTICNYREICKERTLFD